ncbi:MAG: diguanylate cyclase [Oceanospirillaceae bacterium]|nr:diguanylate cyclase [Oceanospirillaceae bacterium]
MKLLIAEDDKTSRLILQSVCKKWGYDVECVEDGQAAWDLMQGKDAPSLMIIDWEMPRMNGVEFCQRISDKFQQNPPYIILLTSRNETQDIVEGLRAGANDYIAKPFNNDELKVRIAVGQRMIELQNKLNATLQKLTELASIDVLTGQLNRRAIMESLTKEIRRTERQKNVQRPEQILCIGMCDIDHFKNINDTYGHLVGDVVLKEVTVRIQDALRVNDSLGRFGGEEFLVITPVDEVDNATAVYQRICHTVAEQPIAVNGFSISVTISCGVTSYVADNDGLKLETLIARADEALYQAKDEGRNRVVLKLFED